MQMDQFENMNIEQLQHIKYLMIVMKKNSKKFEYLDSEFLNKYLTNEEIILFYKALCMYYKNKPKVNEKKEDNKDYFKKSYLDMYNQNDDYKKDSFNGKKNGKRFK